MGFSSSVTLCFAPLRNKVAARDIVGIKLSLTETRNVSWSRMVKEALAASALAQSGVYKNSSSSCLLLITASYFIFIAAT